MITMSNFKGGSGATTLLLLLAHYLANIGKKVVLIDTTLDQHLTRLHDRSVLLEEQLPFEFFSSSLSKVQMLIQRLNHDQAHTVLIDLPQFSFDADIFAIYKKLSIIIIPFQYGMLGLGPTIRFAITANRVIPKAKLIFLPNQLFANYLDADLLAEQQNALRLIGQLSTSIDLLSGLMQLASMHIPPICLISSAASLELLINQYIFPINYSP